MTKINSYAWFFLGIFVVLGTLLYNACAKYIPFLLHNTVYYCREMLQSVLMQPIRLNIKFFMMWGFAALTLYIIVKVFLTVLRVFQQHKSLEEKIVEKDSILPLAKKLHLVNKIRVIQDEQVGAFCFGFTRPKIYISTQMLAITTSDEIEAVLRHEKYHLEHHDTLIMLFAVFTQSLFPFFPLLTDLIAMYRTQREIKADNAAITAMDDGKEHVRSVLSKLLHYDLYPALAIVPSFMDAQTLETRIRTITKKTIFSPCLSIRNVVISILSVAILGGLTIAPVQAIEFHDMGEDAVMACVDPSGACTNACMQTPPISAPQSSRLYSPVQFTSVSY